MPVKIHGKDYKTVAERLKEFHTDHKDCSIFTQIISNIDGEVVMKATIYPVSKEGQAFTGHASEKESSSMINKTSALENAETSAIGRALASAGYIGTEFASADEVANAIKNQNTPKKEEPKTPTRVVNNLQDIEPPIQEPSFVEESLATANIEPSSASETPSNTLTSGQFKFILDLWRNKGKHEAELKEEVVKLFGKELDQITKSEASKFIDQIKAL